MRAPSNPDSESLTPSPAALRRSRERLSLFGELALAALPTVTVLGTLALVSAVTTQRLLFASLASSAFLIYLDPEHGTNRVRALVVSQVLAVALGWTAYAILAAATHQPRLRWSVQSSGWYCWTLCIRPPSEPR